MFALLPEGLVSSMSHDCNRRVGTKGQPAAEGILSLRHSASEGPGGSVQDSCAYTPRVGWRYLVYPETYTGLNRFS